MWIYIRKWVEVPKHGEVFPCTETNPHFWGFNSWVLQMTDLSKLSRDFNEPPPKVPIYPKDWQTIPIDARREIWALWINFRTATDGTFHVQLQAIIDSRDLKQKELASIINQSESVVSRWFQGRKLKGKEGRNHIPDHLSIVEKIADELDCTPMEKLLLRRAYALEVLWLKGFWSDE